MLCKPSRDGVSRKPRALLCKPSRDGVSRKPRAFMQNGRIYTEIRVRARIAQLGKGRKKKQSENTDKIRKRTEIVQTTKKLIRLHPLWYLTQAAVNRHPPPSPPSLAPHHAAGSPTVNPHADTSGATNSQQIIRRAAAMRVTRYAHASSDSKDTMPVAQMSFVPPADSPSVAGPMLLS